MCYEKPGPRCSGHTRTNFQKAKEALAAAEKDLAEKQANLKVAKSLEARIALHDSTAALKAAQTKLADATKKYEVSKANRAEAMDTYREAKKEYFTSPEGIKKNRGASVNPNLTEEQRAAAARLAHGGQVARDKQIEAYKIAQAEKKHADKVQEWKSLSNEEQLALAGNTNSPATLADMAKGCVVIPDINVQRLGERVAGNPSTPPASLAEMARSENQYIRYYAAGNPSTPAATLASLTDDEEDLVFMGVMQNPNLPQEGMERVISRAIREGEALSNLAQNTSIPASLAEKVYAVDGNRSSTQYSFLENPATPASIIAKIPVIPGNRELFAQHKDAPKETLLALSKFKDWKIRALL